MSGHGPSKLSRETMCFVVASLLDLQMTCLLLGMRSGDNETSFVESNPVACFFLTAWGFGGLIGFKFFMVGFVVACCCIIGSARIGAAKAILKFAAAAGSVVVIYSVGLSIQHNVASRPGDSLTMVVADAEYDDSHPVR